MERDFLGLSSKEPLAVVKEEINDGCKDPGMLLFYTVHILFGISSICHELCVSI